MDSGCTQLKGFRDVSILSENTNSYADDYSVNLARNLESLELNYWNQGLDNFTDADFSAAGYEGIRDFIELFRDQEVAHFTALK